MKITKDVISLDAVYDNPSLVQNMYTAAFVEDGVGVAKMCPGGRKVTVPARVTGELAAANLQRPVGHCPVLMILAVGRVLHPVRPTARTVRVRS